ncbi:conjugation system SOS inhibitor PsiB [Citrobacter sp. Cpo071]|uniref:conjugation system SOS inhibitor PsiB n=1 Tax=Citrobacter sp. Cpo071 TaxID=2985133 RepID=UPI0025759D46|nr:conjugation system SOS inhibitor PsiB [Citrobacter sp. Cpo071]MDM2857182.1 conjugation system SOS inhibitor PsiB [Citrobacter sp. Cpo071]MDM2857277.1 conjugation system SOS inhibitor PsiB [Citrobacter sp. Cpo071]
MQTVLTVDVLKTMSPDEMENWRDSGEDFRRELTHAVMRDISCPENWTMNGEYRSEFGGFFPVQIRFTPPLGNYHVAVCSPGVISPAWMVVFVPASGRPLSVIRTLSGYQPELVSHTVSLTARLDADGYSQVIIISILAAEGAA